MSEETRVKIEERTDKSGIVEHYPVIIGPNPHGWKAKRSTSGMMDCTSFEYWSFTDKKGESKDVTLAQEHYGLRDRKFSWELLSEFYGKKYIALDLLSFPSVAAYKRKVTRPKELRKELEDLEGQRKETERRMREAIKKIDNEIVWRKKELAEIESG